jgi:hypothetical protein
MAEIARRIKIVGNSEKKRGLLKYLIFTLILLSSLGCVGSGSKIIGKWEPVEIVDFKPGEGKKITKNFTERDGIEFFPDHTLLMGTMESGKWNILEDGRLKIDLGFLFDKPFITFGSLKGDTLTIDVPGENRQVIFKKKN